MTCGGGTSTRETECKGGDGSTLPDAQCGAGYQTEDQDCNTDPCQPGVNSKIVVIAGKKGGNEIASVEAFDLSDAGKTCEAMNDYPEIVYGQITEFYGGTMVTCGGIPLVGSSVLKCYEYDKTSKNWIYMADMLSSRYWGRQVSAIGGQMFITAGQHSAVSDTEIWDGSSFVAGPTLPTAMTTGYHCHVTLDSNRVFVSDIAKSTGKSYILDWTSKTWSTMTTLGKSRSWGSCGRAYSAARGIEVLVMGGGGATDVYSVTDDSWRVGPVYGLDGNAHSVAQTGDTFVVVGGSGDETRMFAYDPDGDKFDQLPHTLTNGRSFATAVAVSDDLITCT